MLRTCGRACLIGGLSASHAGQQLGEQRQRAARTQLPAAVRARAQQRRQLRARGRALGQRVPRTLRTRLGPRWQRSSIAQATRPAVLLARGSRVAGARRKAACIVPDTMSVLGSELLELLVGQVKHAMQP